MLSISFPSKWVVGKLGEHIYLRQERIEPYLSSVRHFFLVGLENIESQTGRLINSLLVQGFEIKSSKSVFYPSDILYGKLRPALNKVFLANQEGICSTDILVLKAQNHIKPEYLQFYLRSAFFVKKAEALAIGGQLPRINYSDFLKINIPIPPLEEQQYIVEILQQADELRRLRQESLAKAENLASALFLEMFGNILSNEKQWATQKLDKLCDLVRGSSPRPQGDSRYFGGNIPRLMVADITRDGTYVTPQIDSLTEEGAKHSRPMQADEVVMAVSGAPGLAAILNIDACIHDGFVGFRSLSKQLLPEFFVGVLGAMRLFNERQAMGAVFLNLKSDQIRAWNIIIPPIELQQLYVQRIKEIRLHQKEISLAQENLEKLIIEVNSRAFTGKLTKAWREANPHIQAVKITKNTIPSEPETKPIQADLSLLKRTRKNLLEQLSTFQTTILSQLYAKSSYVTDENLYDFINDLPEAIDQDQEQRVRKTLDQLAALGLIMKLSLQAGKSTQYINAFRALRETDFSKEQDKLRMEQW